MTSSTEGQETFVISVSTETSLSDAFEFWLDVISAHFELRCFHFLEHMVTCLPFVAHVLAAWFDVAATVSSSL